MRNLIQAGMAREKQVKAAGLRPGLRIVSQTWSKHGREFSVDCAGCGSVAVPAEGRVLRAGTRPPVYYHWACAPRV